MSGEVRRLSDAWREVRSLAPGHLAKMEFRLAEQGGDSIETTKSGLSFKFDHVVVTCPRSDFLMENQFKFEMKIHTKIFY